MNPFTIGHLSSQRLPDAVRNVVRNLKGLPLDVAAKPIPLEIENEDLSQYDCLFFRGDTPQWEWIETLMRLKRIVPRIPVIVQVPQGSIQEGWAVMRTVPAVILMDSPDALGGILGRVVASSRKLRKQVLFVDDDDLFLKLYSHAFAKTPWRIFTAADAASALEVLSGKAVDLVVTDIKMPGIHGLKLIEEIRKIDRWIPVIVCSAYKGLKAESDMYFYHVSAFLSKPFDIKVLKEKIMELIG